MYRLQSHADVAKWTTICVFVAVALVAVHTELAYPLEIRPYVRPQAITATFFSVAILAGTILTLFRRNAILTQKLRELVNRDRLTNVATRDFFFDRMEEQPFAYGTSLMIDIDEFKSINDTYGHLAGDAVITRVAEILRRNVREWDLVCRFGGEEFVVFLQDRGPEAGFAVAERMRETIANDVMMHNGTQISVTVSIGGSLKERLMDVEMAIQSADEALYRAKNAGRNRTVFARSRVTSRDNLSIDLWSIGQR